MSDAILIIALGLTLAVIIVVQGLHRRRLRDATAPVGAAASVLRDVYSGTGTEAKIAAEFDPSPSMPLVGDDPLHTYGIDHADKVR